jgi:hypothetical protein
MKIKTKNIIKYLDYIADSLEEQKAENGRMQAQINRDHDAAMINLTKITQTEDDIRSLNENVDKDNLTVKKLVEFLNSHDKNLERFGIIVDHMEEFEVVKKRLDALIEHYNGFINQFNENALEYNENIDQDIKDKKKATKIKKNDDKSLLEVLEKFNDRLTYLEQITQHAN